MNGKNLTYRILGVLCVASASLGMFGTNAAVVASQTRGAHVKVVASNSYAIDEHSDSIPIDEHSTSIPIDE